MAGHTTEDIIFPFPFEPYEIQTEFMRGVFQTLEAGDVGIFESPTGTGKSQSIINSVLYWLKRYAPPLESSSSPSGGDADSSFSSTASASSAGTSVGGSPSSTSWIDDFDPAVAEREHKAVRQAARKAKLERRLRRLRERQRGGGQRRRASGGGGGVGDDDRVDARSSFFAAKGDAPRPQPKPKRARVQAAPPNDNDDDDDVDDDDDEFLVTLGGSATKAPPRSRDRAPGDLSDTTDSDSDGGGAAAAADAPPRVRKVIYCSRTHSQLTQFVAELRKTSFCNDSSSVSGGGVDELCVRVACLASRSQLCVNDKVRLDESGRMRSAGSINERCLKLARDGPCCSMLGKKGKALPGGRGAGFAGGERQRTLHKLRDHALVRVRDIEELATLGRELCACPYYGARTLLPHVELVTMPYSMLVHAATRDALGIAELLTDAVVVIDEAHNLLDAVANAHSCQITKRNIGDALAQLKRYQEKYRTRLSETNLRQIKILRVALRALMRFIARKTAAAGPGSAQSAAKTGATSASVSASASSALSVNAFLLDAGIDDLNIVQLEAYVRESQLDNKLRGFVERGHKKDAAKGGTVQVAASAQSGAIGKGRRSARAGGAAGAAAAAPTASPLRSIMTFLSSLRAKNDDARVLILPGDDDGTAVPNPALKFVLLNAAHPFAEVIAAAHSVLLCGGTLSPIDSMIRELMPQVPRDRITHLSCSHVMPPEHLLSFAVARGPTGAEFDMRFASRGKARQIDELGALLLNVSAVAPRDSGVVAFLPAFAYSDKVRSRWSETGLLARLAARRRVFWERRGGDVDALLASYTRAVHNGGALIICVVGAKLSEGINFSDELARCVIVAGLPFANVGDVEMNARMEYVARCNADDPSAARRYYEDLCLKAVNQSIGRAIRHKNDYAALLLVDQRYATERIASKLPGWIRERTRNAETFGVVQQQLGAFFRARAKDDAL